MDMTPNRLPCDHVAQTPSPHHQSKQGHRVARISLGSEAMSIDLDDTSGGSSFSARVRALNAGDSPSPSATVDGDFDTEFSEHDAPAGLWYSSDSDLDHLDHEEPAGASPEDNAKSDSETVHAHGGSAGDDGENYGGSDSVRNLASTSAARAIPQPSVKRPYHLVDPPLRELNMLRMAKTHSSIMASNYTDAPVPKIQFGVGPTGMSVPPTASQKRRKLISSGPGSLEKEELRLRLNSLANRVEDADLGFRLNWNRGPTTNHNRVRPFLILERQANSPVSDSEESSSHND